MVNIDYWGLIWILMFSTCSITSMKCLNSTTFHLCLETTKIMENPPFDNEVSNIFTRIRHELLCWVDQFLTVVCLTFHCQMGAFPIFVVSKHKLKIAEFQQMLWNIIGTSKFRSVLNNQIFNHLFDCMPILTTSFIVSFDKMQEMTSSGNSLIWSLLN